jgi:hypothetical protein
VVSDRATTVTSGRFPLCDVLCRVAGQTGDHMNLGGYASITDMSTGRPERIKYSVLVQSGTILVQ